MKKVLFAKWFRDVPIAHKLYFTVGIMALLIVIELFALTFSIGALSSVRAYVNGEGLWSKAEKDAVSALLRYGNSHNGEDYRQFKEFMRVPLGDSKSRSQLIKAVPDLNIARQGYIEGRNNPEDVEGMIRLFRRFNRISYIHKAIRVWGEAEPLVLQLLPIGERLDNEINSSSPSQEKINKILQQIEPLNKQLTPLEDDFSFTLGEGSRWLEHLVLRLLFGIALTVEITGLLLAISVSRGIQKGISEIIDAAGNFAKGNLDTRSKVFSNDEIGVLANSFNQMSEQLQHNIGELEKSEANFKASLTTVAESEKKYRDLFQNNPMPMWIIDFPSFRFLDVNDAARKQYGYTRKEFLAMTALDIRPVEEKVRFLEFNHSVPAGPLITGVWKHLKKDGTIIYAEVTVSEIMFAGKQSRLVLSNDVTERIKTEEKIRMLNGSLEEKVKLRTVQLESANKELESFSYSVSHDLRTPLRSINGFSRILAKRYGEKLDTEGKEFLKIISDSTVKMGLLIDGLLKLGRLDKENLSKTMVNLDDMLKQIIDEMKSADTDFNATISIHGLKPVLCDLVLTKQVWVNLLSNAVKYSRKKEHTLIEIGLIHGKETPVYYVKDNGAGFDMKYSHHLFELFKRVHSEDDFEGVGVGLALVSRIIKKHGGKIWAESEVGKGATFYFTLCEAEEVPHALKTEYKEMVYAYPT